MAGGVDAGLDGAGSADGEPEVVNRDGGEGGRRGGCLVALALAAILAVGGASFLSSLSQIGGEPGHEVRTDGRWVSRDVTLTPEAPRVALTVVVTYPRSMADGGGVLAVSAPRFGEFPAAGTPIAESPTDMYMPIRPTLPVGLTPAPFASAASGSPGLDPLADPDILVEISTTNSSPNCHAPCELLLRSNACPSAAGDCTQSFPLSVSLADSAGRGIVVVRIRAGLTVEDASIPDGFKVEIRDSSAHLWHTGRPVA